MPETIILSSRVQSFMDPAGFFVPTQKQAPADL
jgi:hypothetical protein